MNNVMDTMTEYRDRTRVEIENLCPWSVGFKSYTIPGDGNHSVIVPGSEFAVDGTRKKSIYRHLTLEEVITQISRENSAFCGVDGKGTHAAFRICDFELYKVAFDLSDATEYPIQLTQEEIDKLLKIKEPKKFKAKMDELVVTESEKYTLAIAVSNYEHFEEISFKILQLIEKKTGRTWTEKIAGLEEK